jgi:Zn-dependent protease
MNLDIAYLILRIPVILLALTVHECAHAYTAWKLGDPTARNAGRITLNPMAHLDLFGTLMLFIGPFGWAKPVPVNINNLRSQRDDIYVSLAGPFSNIMLALLFGYALRLLTFFIPGIFSITFLHDFFILSIMLNLGLAFFNLLPVPPLDGSHVLGAFLPEKYAYSYYELMKYGPFFLVFLIVIDRKAHVLSLLFHHFYAFWSFLIFWQP